MRMKWSMWCAAAGLLAFAGTAYAQAPFVTHYQNRESTLFVHAPSRIDWDDGYAFRWLQAEVKLDRRGVAVSGTLNMGETGYHYDVGGFTRAVFCWFVPEQDTIVVSNLAKSATLNVFIADLSACNLDAWPDEGPFTGPLTVTLSISDPTLYNYSVGTGAQTDLNAGTAVMSTCKGNYAQGHQNVASTLNGDPWLYSDRTNAYAQASSSVCNVNNKSQ